MPKGIIDNNFARQMKLFDLTPAIPSSLLPYWQLLGTRENDVEATEELYLLHQFKGDGFTARHYQQRTGTYTMQELFWLHPDDSPEQKTRHSCPGILIPFYHPDEMCGFHPCDGSLVSAPRPTVLFAFHLVRLGFSVLCSEAYPYNLISRPQECDIDEFSWWPCAAKAFPSFYPNWCGMGKLTSDAATALNFLATRPEIDAQRLGVMGHSLGGKIAFYLAIFDQRIRAAVANDFGLRFEQSNWDAPWYWTAERLQRLQKAGISHGSMLAERPTLSLLVIGGEYDDATSDEELEIARKSRRLRLDGDPAALRLYVHGTGHVPNFAALEAAYRFFGEQFHLQLPEKLDFSLPLSPLTPL